MKTLFLTGSTWMFLTPEQMYGDEGLLRTAHYNYQNADIYFLTKMKKVRFNINQSCITDDGQIRVVISIGDPSGTCEERTFVFPPIDLIYSLPHISQKFENRDHFFFYALSKLYRPEKILARVAHGLGKVILEKNYSWHWSFALMKWAYSKEIRITHKNEFEVSIHDPLVRILTNEQRIEQFKHENPTKYSEMKEILDAEWNEERLKKVDFLKLPGHESRMLRLTIDQVVNRYGVDVGPQKIVYIGKTERAPFERLLPHTKLQELQAKFLRNNGEAIVVHLFSFNSHDIENFKARKSVVKNSVSISATESELINYFKPEMNSDYLQDKGRPKWEHVLWMKAHGYGSIFLEMAFEHQYTKFVSESVSNRDPSRHCFITDLNSFNRITL